MSNQHPSSADSFKLSAEPEAPNFELEPSPADPTAENFQQAELYFSEHNAEQPESSPQIEFEGMQPPRFRVSLADGQEVFFQHAPTLLESLEAQNVDIHYQCREGYCGSCRVRLLKGEVHYLLEPMAWLNQQEILTCCSVPKSDIQIEIPGL